MSLFSLVSLGVTFLQLLLILPVNSENPCEQKRVVDNLEKLILEQVDESITYDFPNDNSEYFKGSKGGQVTDYGTFDFIIIGSGSTGSVLANRLSARSSWTILLLEAGDLDNEFTNIPSMYSFALRSKYNWGYNTTSQKFGCKGMIRSECSYPRGKILGGSSSVNGLIYTRGNPKDYDNWEKLGNIGWSYKYVEPFFIKMENAQFVGTNLGHTGPMYMNYSSPLNPFQETYFEAFEEVGIPQTEYNSGEQLGTSRIQSNIKYGKRVSGANAYIRPIWNRVNLNVTLGSLVTKIMIHEHNNTAYAVRFVRNGETYEAIANKEIILSAGAVNSPQILMLSGIGPKDLMNKYNIPIRQDLPVGETLIDQIAYNLQFSSNYTQDFTPLRRQILDFLDGEGLLTTPFNGKSLSFVNKDVEGRPKVEYVLLPPTGGFDYSNRSQVSPYIHSINEDYISKIDPRHFFSITMTILHPKSTGKVSIKSSDPKDFPLIDSGIFSNEEDIQDLYDAIQFITNITKTEPFRRINATVFSPVPPCYEHVLYSKEYWYCNIRYMALPTYHAMGTTLMGVNPKTAVVNHELRVYGIKNLRVADCGIIPESISGHTNGPAFMIGEKLSSMILKEYCINKVQ